MAHRTPIVILSFALLLGGCGSVPAPMLTVENVSVGERTEQGLVALFTIVGANEGSEPLPLRSVSYTVSLGGKQVFAGRRAPLVTLPPRGDTRFTIPAAVDARDLPAGTAGGVFEFTFNGRVIYSEPGPISTILFDSGISQPSTAFKGTGVLDLSR